MTEMLPYRVGMSLGTTYDLRNHSTGQQIFAEEYTANPQTKKCPLTLIKYNVIKSSADVNRLLDISGDISLKAKAGFLDVQGILSYLVENRYEENALEILIVAHVETITTKLMNPKPVTNWNKGKMGTHFIYSVIYGGDLLFSIRIITPDSKRLEHIKADVDSELQTEGILSGKTESYMRHMEKKLIGCSEIQLKYYSTLSDIKISKDVGSMLEALGAFQDQLKQINNGNGAPLRCELVSLTYIDPDFPAILRQTGLETQLTDLEEMYDDIRQAKCMLKKCLQDAKNYKTDEKDEKGSEIQDRIEKVMLSFNNVISRLDVTIDRETSNQIQQSTDFYRKIKKLGGFRSEVKRFIKYVQSHKEPSASGMSVKDLPLGGTLNILLIGKTGHGKSATANSIFGEQKFNLHTSSDPLSISCQMEIGSICGREICLVDTPGITDTKYDDVTFKELRTAIAKRPQGFHAFIFVINIDVRITLEEKEAIETLKKIFGQDILVKYGVIVFTHGDSFVRNKKTTFLKHIKSQGGYIKKILKACDYRCALIDNLEEDIGILRDQVISIILLIDKLVETNNGKTYNSQMFEIAQKKIEEGQKDSAKSEKNKRCCCCCFPPDALVTLNDGTTIPIADLRIGQKVLSSVSSRTLIYSEVYLFAHLNPNLITEYIRLRSAKQTLKLTPEHHIYVIRHGHIETVAAREVKIGDSLLVINTLFSTLIIEPLTEISESTEVGVYAPITMSGTIIVNNVLATCYVDIVPPLYSHLMMWPVRQLYRISPSLSAHINAAGKEGIPNWIQWIMDNLLAQ